MSSFVLAPLSIITIHHIRVCNEESNYCEQKIESMKSLTQKNKLYPEYISYVFKCYLIQISPQIFQHHFQ